MSPVCRVVKRQRDNMLVRQALYFQRETAGSLPLLDLYETEGCLVLEVDLPGIDPEDVLIKAYEDIVIIEGIKKEIREEKEFKYLCMERSFESFRRIVKIPVPVRTHEGKASYNDGVVTLTFPKVKDRVIKIRIEK
jgi:HSP20 family protein